MTAKRWSAVLFDLDGTLSDSIPCCLHCSKIVHQEMDLPWDEAEQRSYISLPIREIAADVCGAERAEEYLSRLRQQNQIWLPRLLRPFPGVPELLADLQAAGIACAVVTSRQSYGTRISCDTLGITPYFQVIISADQVAKHKPDAEPAQKALAALGIQPAQAVFVGDSPVDVGCGKNAGLSTIAVSWGISERSALAAVEPDYICDTAAELRALLLP